jgi:cytochrome P450
MVSLHSFAIMNDPKVFPEPDTFKPERFLDSNGKYLSTRPQGFIPFGMGIRVCLGEKLALANFFLIVVNLLQKTHGYEFALPSGPGSADIIPYPYANNGLLPKSYKIMLKKSLKS